MGNSLRIFTGDRYDRLREQNGRRMDCGPVRKESERLRRIMNSETLKERFRNTLISTDIEICTVARTEIFDFKCACDRLLYLISHLDTDAARAHLKQMYHDFFKVHKINLWITLSEYKECVKICKRGQVHKLERLTGSARTPAIWKAHNDATMRLDIWQHYYFTETIEDTEDRTREDLMRPDYDLDRITPPTTEI